MLTLHKSLCTTICRPSFCCLSFSLPARGLQNKHNHYKVCETVYVTSCRRVPLYIGLLPNPLPFVASGRWIKPALSVLSITVTIYIFCSLNVMFGLCVRPSDATCVWNILCCNMLSFVDSEINWQRRLLYCIWYFSLTSVYISQLKCPEQMKGSTVHR
jgi:hypothetical protein